MITTNTMFKTNLKSHALTFAFITLMCICGPDSVTCGDEFGYDGKMGPSHWGEQYNTCGGKFQSPININILEVVDRSYRPIIMHGFHVVPENATLENNGHTVIAKFTYKDGQTPTVHGGSLGSQGIYRFSQFHFHWGDNDTVGSEDRINNVSFPAELHMVFYNIKYETFQKAVAHSGGVAVLAFFFAIQKDENPYYVEFSHLLGKVQQPHMSATFKGSPPPLSVLINDDTENYFTYTGSLTTPPCSEDVTWIDFEEPIMISAEQIKPFRNLYTLDGIPLTHNFRPVQPLNNRTVFKAMPMPSPAFQPHNYDSSNSGGGGAADAVVVKSIVYLFTAYLWIKMFSLCCCY